MVELTLVAVHATVILLFALATLLLWRTPGQRAGRVFAYLLLTMAVSDLPRSLLRSLGVDIAAWNWTQPYLLIAIPFLTVYFLALFPRPRTWVGRHPAGPYALAAVALAVEVLYFLDHDLYRAVDPARVSGPIELVTSGQMFVAALAGALFARDYLRAPAGPGRSSLLLVALAFGLLPAYSGTRVLLYEVVGLETLSNPTLANYLALRTHYIPWLASLPLVALTFGYLAKAAARAKERSVRLQSRAGFTVLAVAPLAAAFVTFFYLTWPQHLLLIAFVFPTLFTLALPVLVAYALLRYRIFDIDLKVKFVIRQGTLAAGFIGAAFLGSQVLGLYVPDGAVVGAVLSAGLLVFALTHMQRFATQLADRALPGVQDDEAYLNLRKVEVYRSALEQAVGDGGAIGRREAAMLASLREELGVSERDHALLEHAVRASRPGGMGEADGELAPGATVLGRFRVVATLGEGAHGRTYLAEDPELARKVVVKALLPGRAGDPAVLREARAIAALRHPNVVTVHDVARAGSQAFIVMEHVEGGSLQARVQEQGAVDAAAFRRVALGLLAALDAVHGEGLVHRDVKPANVLLTATGEAKLADFGIAHQPGLETTAGGLGQGGATAIAAAVGTVRFMSPEQARGRRVTARSDLFSAAATLYEACTGKPYLAPERGESVVELQMRAARGRSFEQAVGSADFAGPPALRAWFARALAPDPEARFGGTREAAAALEVALDEAAGSATRDAAGHGATATATATTADLAAASKRTRSPQTP